MRSWIGWSLGTASLWTWGLLGLRMLRDGPQPLEVWFSYSLSFLMTAVYVYLALLIYSTLRAERGVGAETLADAAPGRFELFLSRTGRPLSLMGLAGLAVAVVSLVGWLTLRYPGPRAVPGTYASVVLAIMVLGVVLVSTLIARGARQR